jgi:class 3 adenylate cyclase
MSVLPSGTVTFLFSDIEGSTRLTRELGEEWGEVLAEHRRLMREAAAAAHGREVDTQGDAFFFAFPRARDAVTAAVEAQRAHAAATWPRGGAVRVRMAIHTGEPSVGDEGYFGLDVVRAARLCGTAQGGQVLVSATTRALLGPDALDDVELRDLGELKLKDLEHAEHVFQVVAPGLRTDFAAIVPARAGVPAPFAGHERELEREARAVAFDFSREISEQVRRRVERQQHEVFERLRERGIIDDVPPAPRMPPRELRSRAFTGALVLAAFVVLVVAAAVVATIYLLFG